MFAVSLAILSQEFHGRERGTAFGIWGATVGAAVAIGPLVGGALTEWAGWRWIFFVNLPIGIACVFGALAYLHESRDEQHGGFDGLGFAFLTGGLFSLVLALLRGNGWGWGSGRTIGLLRGRGRAASGVRRGRARASARRCSTSASSASRRSRARRSSRSRSRPRCSRSSSS